MLVGMELVPIYEEQNLLMDVTLRIPNQQLLRKTRTRIELVQPERVQSALYSNPIPLSPPAQDIFPGYTLYYTSTAKLQDADEQIYETGSYILAPKDAMDSLREILRTPNRTYLSSELAEWIQEYGNKRVVCTCPIFYRASDRKWWSVQLGHMNQVHVMEEPNQPVVNDRAFEFLCGHRCYTLVNCITLLLSLERIGDIPGSSLLQALNNVDPDTLHGTSWIHDTTPGMLMLYQHQNLLLLYDFYHYYSVRCQYRPISRFLFKILGDGLPLTQYVVEYENAFLRFGIHPLGAMLPHATVADFNYYLEDTDEMPSWGNLEPAEEEEGNGTFGCFSPDLLLLYENIVCKNKVWSWYINDGGKDKLEYVFSKQHPWRHLYFTFYSVSHLYENPKIPKSRLRKLFLSQIHSHTRDDLLRAMVYYLVSVRINNYMKNELPPGYLRYVLEILKDTVHTRIPIGIYTTHQKTLRDIVQLFQSFKQDDQRTLIKGKISAYETLRLFQGRISGNVPFFMNHIWEKTICEKLCILYERFGMFQNKSPINPSPNELYTIGTIIKYFLNDHKEYLLSI